MFRNHLVRWLLGRNRNSRPPYPRLKVITNDFIGDEIISYERYEAQEIHLLSVLFDFNSRVISALDIGANIGNHTVPMAELFDQVLAFEPHPVSVELLKINTSELDNISVYPFGLSDFNGKSMLSFSNKNFGKASVSNLQEQSVEVPLKKGDDVVNVPVGFIKIDIEGHEFQAIEGLKKTIQKHLPIIAFEFNPKHENNSTLIDLLNELGYTKYYVPYRKSLFRKSEGRRFYQVVIDDLFFKPTNSIKQVDLNSSVFENLIFTEALVSKFRINKAAIRS